MLLLSFIKQFFYLLFVVFRTHGFVSFFAGYSSFLPGVFSKITGKPHIIILGGTDCTSLPEIGYGNFQKKILSWFTSKSLLTATHLAPVSENLIFSEYSYFDTVHPKQGYKTFCPNAKAETTVIYIGYDPKKFSRTTEKKSNSFLTVAQMNAANYFRKGIDLIFQLAGKFPQCTFTIVGNTSEMQYETVPHNIQLLPFVKYEELISIYSEHEFYLQLSMMEGFPSAPCEAMLCECIPVTSNVGALEEIVGNTGFILRKKDIQQLTALIQKALNSDRNKLGVLARERIITKFPPEERYKLIELIKAAV